jgi:hypothetical protein
MATTNQARLPATAEFDAQLAKLYDKALSEVHRHLRKATSNIKLDINKILIPTSSEQEDERISRMFTKKRLKILDAMETLVRGLIAGRNRVSLFDMFDENNPMGRGYARRYNKIKMDALNRLETGVSLIKFERTHDIPLQTILFPSRNTNLYIARYEILKQHLLTKVSKGIRNIRFTAPVVHKSFKLTKIEKTQADVPIDAFLIPTPNTNFFTARYNWSKHILLNKVHQGIKNLQFVAPYEHKSFKLTRIEKQRKDVPIDLFLMPSGNTWYYSAKYELAKLKLLKKVKQGINSIEFENQGKVNLLEYLMPDVEGSADVQHIVGKALAKNMTRESKARAGATSRAARANEYQIHKREKRLDAQLKLDEERNRILMDAFFGKGRKTRTTAPTKNKDRKRDSVIDSVLGEDGVWTATGAAAGSLGGKVSQSLIKNGPAIARAIGPALGVAAAGAIGYGIGSWLDKNLGISDIAGRISSDITEWMGNKDYVKNVVEPGLAKDPATKMIYRELTGGIKQSASEKARLYDQARNMAKKRMEMRRKEFESMGYEYSPEDLRSLKPTDYIKKSARAEKIELRSSMMQPDIAEYFNALNNQGNTGSSAQFGALLEATKDTNKLMRENKGISIINSRGNLDKTLNQNLDNYFMTW